MRRFSMAIVALSLFAAGSAQAWAADNTPPRASNTPPRATNVAPQRYYRAAPARSYSYYPRQTNVWPYYPNYGNNPVGAAYSQAAGMRPGQFFGTFGLRPADARARGAY